jgi:AcrR family transcriptional regulator
MGRTKREKILETAMRLFIERGIHGTATSLIAREAGVATGTLFHHFASKEDLVHALYHAIYDSLLEYKETRIDMTADIREKLRQQWQLDIEWGTAHVEEFHFLERYSFLYYASESAINEIFDRFQNCIALFREAVEQKRLKSDDLDYIREHFIWNIRMNIAFFIEHPEKCTPEATEQSFEIYWKGIAYES